VERKVHRYTKLTVPKVIQKNLPFIDMPKKLQKRDDPFERVAVVREPHEARVSDVLNL